jgi:hypothetical protein
MQGAGGLASGVMTGLYWGIIIASILGCILFIIYIFSFNIDVVIRHKTKMQDQIEKTKAKVVKDGKDGVEKLAIRFGLFKRKYMVAPPPEVISPTMKGKWFIEIELTADGSMRYITKTTEKDGEPKLRPLNTNDRIFMINEEEKRIARHKKPLAELVREAVPYIALVIIVGCFLAFFADVVKPFNERMAAAESSLIEEKKLDLQIIQELGGIKNDIQIIRNGEQASPNGQVAVPDATVTSPPPE